MGVVVLSLSGGTVLGGGPGVTEGPRLLAGFLAGGVDFALGSGLACIMKSKNQIFFSRIIYRHKSPWLHHSLNQQSDH